MVIPSVTIPHDRRNRDPQATDDQDPTHLLGIDGNAGERHMSSTAAFILSRGTFITPEAAA